MGAMLSKVREIRSASVRVVQLRDGLGRTSEAVDEDDDLHDDASYDQL